MTEFKRRDFLKLTAAGVTLSAAGCATTSASRGRARLGYDAQAVSRGRTQAEAAAPWAAYFPGSPTH